MMTRSPASLHADEGGQISSLGVLAAAAFACLLMLVINTGYATSGKIELQNAADATAISGATWVARGLNVISLNNVTQTQLLAITLIVPALDKAFELAHVTLQVQRAACAALLVGAGVCAAIITAQIAILETYQTALQGPLWAGIGRRDGSDPLWKAMQVLSSISGVVKTSFVGAAELEAARIAGQNRADAGLLIPAAYRPTLPVHEGAVRPDLCHPTRHGRQGPDDLGVTGYEGGDGPLENFAGNLGVLWYPIENSFVRAYFRGFREAEYQMLCGGSGYTVPTREQVEREQVRSRSECVYRGGGTAVWGIVLYESIPFAAPQPSLSYQGEHDRNFNQPPAGLDPPLQRSCAWTPPGVRIGDERYRRTEEEVGTTQDADGNPVRTYRYRIYEYGFLGASLDGEDDASPVNQPVAGRPPVQGDPNPYLLDEDAEEGLRYLAVVYRTQSIAAAPTYFRSALGERRLAYAQARVYNPTAFDTFTQNWRVALEPASLIEDGTLVGGLGNANVTRLISGTGAAAGFNGATGLFEQLNLLQFFNNH
jgi:hypothetical protein